LGNKGQTLLPLVELIEQSRLAIDELFDVLGSAHVETVPQLSAESLAGPRHPGEMARSLATGRSSLIGVMVPDSTNAYCAEVIRGIEEAATSAGYDVVLGN